MADKKPRSPKARPQKWRHARAKPLKRGKSYPKHNCTEEGGSQKGFQKSPQ